MKTVSIFHSNTRVPQSIVALLLCLTLQHNLFAPPATPSPYYYGDEFGTGGYLQYVPDPTNSTKYILDDWNIPTPDGPLTPADSTVTGSTYGSPYAIATDPLYPYLSPFPSFFLSPTQIPLDDLNFSGTGSLAGDSFGINMGGDNAGKGSITDTDKTGTHTSSGTWSIPDQSNTLPLLLFVGIFLAVAVPRRFAKCQVLSRNDVVEKKPPIRN